MANIKLAFRTLARTPFVTSVAAISLALGIGANAAIFSMFNELILRPLPVSEPERLVNLQVPGPKPGSTSCNQAGDCEAVFSYPMYKDLERAQTSFTGLAAHRIFSTNISYNKQSESAEAMYVSGSYFPVLGMQPSLGRLLTPRDDETIGAHFVAVLSYRYWESKLGADPGVMGTTIIINGEALTIVGVAPKGFDGTTLGSQPVVFVPITMRGLLTPGWRASRQSGFDNRRNYWAYVFGRLKPGVTIEQAQLGVNAVYKPIINEVEAPLQQGMSDQTMQRFRAKQVLMEEGRRGQSSMHSEARTPLFMLLAVTGIVLLIACANIANLLLARGAGRATEMAVRLSLGASRRQLMVQLLTESCILGLFGGAIGLLVARWTLSLMGSILPGDAAAVITLQLQWPVVVFAMAMSLGTGILFGLFPALHSTRPDLISSIKANASQPAGARAANRFRTSLVTVQVALSMALLISAGLFIKSLRNLSRVDLGLDVENVVTFGISPELSGYDSTRARQFFARVEEEFAALPGVRGVTSGVVALLSGSNWGNSVHVEGFKVEPDTDNNSRFNAIGPDYFRVMGVQILAGREFTTSDAADAPRVAIVNETFAKKFNLGRDAVGKRMSNRGADSMNIEIVGLVKDAKYSEVKDQIPPLFFTPYRQDSWIGSLTFYVRTALPSSELMRQVPQVIARLDPNLPVENLKTLPQQVKENVFIDRMISMMSAAFAILATLLAAVGLYGVLAYTVAQRTREIGVRMALGANGASVRTMVLRQVGILVLVGGLIGVGAALAIGRAAKSLLFGLEGNDPVVYALAGVMLALVALAAGYLPALRASRVHPMQALRYE
jgi:predicted permease